MGGKQKSMLRALFYHFPNATAEQAFRWGWKHGQGRYASKRMHELEAENQRLRNALTSIARNTCCDRCQEAALVAKQALTGEDGDE